MQVCSWFASDPYVRDSKSKSRERCEDKTTAKGTGQKRPFETRPLSIGPMPTREARLVTRMRIGILTRKLLKGPGAQV